MHSSNATQSDTAAGPARPSAGLPPAEGGARTWPDALVLGVIFFDLTGVIVLLGVMLGANFVQPSPVRGHLSGLTQEAYANWDAQWYAEIAERGYSYDPNTQSSVAFFPAFPMLGRGLARATGIGAGLALLVVANLAYLAALVLTARYVTMRWGAAPAQVECYVLLLMGLLPTTFFFRMPYSESLFLLLTTLLLYGFERRWPLLVLAFVVGLATATRPVGVALTAPFLLHAWRRPAKLATWKRVVWPIALVPIACWGLILFMLYQHAAFGEPLAFTRTSIHWRVHRAAPPGDDAVALLTLRPLWGMFVPESEFYWERNELHHQLLLSLHASGPLWFVLEAALVGWGAARRWLTVEEVVAAIALLAVPYITTAYDHQMQSMPRYTALVVPAYYVAGRLLARVPAPLAAGIAGISGFLLGTNAALFAAWYKVF
jgi:hypothetical protein